MSVKEKSGRIRSSNFTSDEVEQLLKLCNASSGVLENKKTDNTTNMEKSRAWEEIEKKFNASSIGSAFRKKESLAAKYDGIKKALKKEVSEYKQRLKGTGGGGFVPLRKFSENEEILLQNIILSVDGLPNWYGDVQNEGIMSTQYVEQLLEQQADDPSTVLVDWSKHSPAMLRTLKHPSLKSSTAPQPGTETEQLQPGTYIVQTDEICLNSNQIQNSTPIPNQCENTTSGSNEVESTLPTSNHAKTVQTTPLALAVA